jgi:hypothetical protein
MAFSWPIRLTQFVNQIKIAYLNGDLSVSNTKLIPGPGRSDLDGGRRSGLGDGGYSS